VSIAREVNAEQLLGARDGPDRENMKYDAVEELREILRERLGAGGPEDASHDMRWLCQRLLEHRVDKGTEASTIVNVMNDVIQAATQAYADSGVDPAEAWPRSWADIVSRYIYIYIYPYILIEYPIVLIDVGIVLI
jgi:hypothetical protein